VTHVNVIVAILINVTYQFVTILKEMILQCAQAMVFALHLINVSAKALVTLELCVNNLLALASLKLIRLFAVLMVSVPMPILAHVALAILVLIAQSQFVTVF